MGEHIDRLVALSGVEHVKAYTKKDGTHVSSHTRTGGKFHVVHPDGTVSTRNSKTMNYTHAVEQKTSKGEYKALQFSTSEQNAMKGMKNLVKYGFNNMRVVPVQRQGDIPATKTPDQPVKIPEKPAEASGPAVSKLQTAEGKVVKYNPKKHPEPAHELGKRPDGSRIIDRRLKKLPNGEFQWEYLYGAPGVRGGTWKTKI